MICPICKKKMVEHIIEEGARYHVNWWDGNGRHCSTTNCEDNHGRGKCKKDDTTLRQNTQYPIEFKNTDIQSSGGSGGCCTHEEYIKSNPTEG